MAREVTQRQRAEVQQFYYRLHAGVEGGEFQERYEQEDIGKIVGFVQQARLEVLREAMNIVEDWPLGIEDRLGLLDRLAREGVKG